MQEQPESRTNSMQITITAKARHALLWEARKLFKSQKEMAEFLGLKQQFLGKILNLQWFCNLKQERFLKDPKWISVFQKLMDLTGRSIYEIFPEELAGQKLNNKIEVSKDVPLQDLLDHHQEPYYLMDDYHDQKDLKRQIDNVLQTLTPREEKIIRLRFGLDGTDEHTLEEIGEGFEITNERVKQILAKALRKLNHPSRSKRLLAFADGCKRVEKTPAPASPFTFPVFARNLKHPFNTLVPVGETRWPNIVTTFIPRAFKGERLMVPFSRNLGAFLPVTYSAARKHHTLISLLSANHSAAFNRKLLKGPKLTKEEWENLVDGISKTTFSTGLINSAGDQTLPEDPLFQVLMNQLPGWESVTAYVPEKLDETVFHQIQALEHKTRELRFIYTRNIFGNMHRSLPRIFFSFSRHSAYPLGPSPKNINHEDIVEAQKRLLSWLQTHIGPFIGFELDLINQTEWFFSFREASEVPQIIQSLKDQYRIMIKTFRKYIELAGQERAERRKEENRRHVEEWKRRKEAERIKYQLALEEEEQRKKEEIEFQSALITLDAQEALRLAVQNENNLRNLKRAVVLYKLSAEKGDPQAQYRLSQKHLFGLGVPQDIQEAVRLLTMASKQGYPDAELSLAQLYEFGKGVEQNRALSFTYYQLAGLKGHPLALFRLAEIYENGEGVSQNLEQAEAYYEKAVQCGSLGADSRLYQLRIRRGQFHESRP